MQIMLVGQPELENILNLDRMRQLRQRIPGICKIPMLNREETNNYINFRIHVVSEGKDAPVFYENAVDEIYYYSGGIPRLINVLCDRVLLHGYVGNTRRIDGNLVREAMRDLKDKEKIPVDRLKR